jgi:hypothetical protein
MLLPVAYKRFVDNVPKAVDEQLVLGIARGLQDALATGLGLDSHDAQRSCLQSRHVLQRRERSLSHVRNGYWRRRMSCLMPLRIRMYLDSRIRLDRRVYYVLTETIVPIVEIVPGR